MMNRYLQPMPIAIGVSVLGICSILLMNFFRLEPPAPNPFIDRQLYVDPNFAAVHQVAAWRDERPEDAVLLERIAREPHAAWFGDWNEDVRADVDAYVSAATEAGALPLLVAYNVPMRDCGSHSGGGAADAEAYRVWIEELVHGINQRQAVLILEPDGITEVNCLDDAERAERFALLKETALRLSALPHLHVYLDAGNVTWLSAGEAAQRLREAGIEHVHGFSLNVSNFYANELNHTYGRAVSRKLGGKNFVIDTSRNGHGATEDDEWCNPAGRALGTMPRIPEEPGYLDAYLWIKTPGLSDGTCNDGPPAGEWWPEYALELARNAAQLENGLLQ